MGNFPWGPKPPNLPVGEISPGGTKPPNLPAEEISGEKVTNPQTFHVHRQVFILKGAHDPLHPLDHSALVLVST